MPENLKKVLLSLLYFYFGAVTFVGSCKMFYHYIIGPDNWNGVLAAAGFTITFLMVTTSLQLLREK